MKPMDFALLTAICLVWGLNMVVSRIVLIDVPPFFYAFLRFALIALVLSPFLFPLPKNLPMVALAGFCLGGAHFAFLFLALANGTASSVSIAGQLGLPFTTILSMMFLGEQIRWRRGVGMALAFIGVIIIAVKPGAFSLSLGVMLGATAALVASIGGVVMKRMEPVGLMQMQAWAGLVSWPVLLPMTLALEQNQIAAVTTMGWPFLAALVFSVLVVSIFGHGMYYRLVQRYEVTMLAPLTLMTPVFAVAAAAIILGEPLSAQLLIGGAVSLIGVAIVAARPNLRLRDAAVLWRRMTE